MYDVEAKVEGIVVATPSIVVTIPVVKVRTDRDREVISPEDVVKPEEESGGEDTDMSGVSVESLGKTTGEKDVVGVITTGGDTETVADELSCC